MIQKYGAALISIALVAFAFLKTALAGDIDAAEVAQLVALVAGAFITYLVPLVSGPWAGVLKTGFAAIAAAATAVGPFVLQGYITAEQWTVVILAVLNVLGVQLGVAARTSALNSDSLIPGTTQPAALVDPEGAKALRIS